LSYWCNKCILYRNLLYGGTLSSNHLLMILSNLARHRRACAFRVPLLISY